MNETYSPLVSDPYMWLLQKLQEAVKDNPEATMADGLEYALGCLDKRFDEGQEVMEGQPQWNSNLTEL